MSVSKLLQAHMREVLGLEDQAASRLESVYREAMLEIVTRVSGLDASGQGETAAAIHLSAIGAQVHQALDTMWRAQGRELGAAFREALGVGGRQQIAEIADLEGRFGSRALAVRISLIPPVIPVDTVAYLAAPQNLLLARFRDTVETRISRNLSTSVLMGEGIDAAVRRMQRDVPARAPGDAPRTVSEAKAERRQLETLVRTEINQAVNVGHAHALNTAAEAMPSIGLEKQWSAHLDNRTSNRCRGLHLQVRPLDREFVSLTDGWRGAAPVAHPNCRCRCLPHSARWEDASRRRKTERETLGGDLNPIPTPRRRP